MKNLMIKDDGNFNPETASKSEREYWFKECLKHINPEVSIQRMNMFDALKYYGAKLFDEEISLIVASGATIDDMKTIYIRLLPCLKGKHIVDDLSTTAKNMIELCKDRIEKIIDNQLGSPLFKSRFFPENDNVYDRFCLELDCYLNGKGHQAKKEAYTDYAVKEIVDNGINNLMASEIRQVLGEKKRKDLYIIDTVKECLYHYIRNGLEGLYHEGVVDKYKLTIEQDLYLFLLRVDVDFYKNNSPYMHKRLSQQITYEALGL